MSGILAMTTHEPRPLVLHKSRVSSGVLLAGSTGILAVCLGAVLRGSQDQVLAGLVACAAGVVAVVALLNFLDRTPQVIVDETGVTYEDSTVPWSRIRSARYHDDSLNVGHYVQLDLDEGSPVRIICAGSLVSLTMTADELHGEVTCWLDGRRGTDQSSEVADPERGGSAGGA